MSKFSLSAGGLVSAGVRRSVVFPCRSLAKLVASINCRARWRVRINEAGAETHALVSSASVACAYLAVKQDF